MRHFRFALQIEPRTLGAWNDGERKGSLPACLVYKLIERLIIMRWIMMKGHQPLDSRCSRKFERMCHRTMSPTDPVSILCGRILRIVDQQIDACRQLEARDPIRVSGNRRTPIAGS